MRWKLVWAAAVTGVLLAACGVKDGTTQKSATADFCQSLCEAWLRCGAGDAGCTARCVSSIDFEYTQPEGVEMVASCLDGESCSTLLGDTPTNACFESTAQVFPPSPVAVSYCEQASKKLFECNVWWGTEECTGVVSLWTDEVLQQAMLCDDRVECDDYDACVSATFEVFR